MPLEDDSPKYWVKMDTVPQLGDAGNGRPMFTGGMDFVFRAMCGDQVLKSYRASTYGGQRYAESEANTYIERLRAAKLRAAEKASPKAPIGGGSEVSATGEARTKWQAAAHGVAAAAAAISTAREDLEIARALVQGEADDSTHDQAQECITGINNAINDIADLVLHLGQVEGYADEMVGLV